MNSSSGMETFRTKIIAGKRVRVPVESGYNAKPFVEAKYPNLPPISSGERLNIGQSRSGTRNEEYISQRISHALRTVSREKLRRAREELARYEDSFGHVKSYELDTVLRNHRIVTLDPIILKYLTVDKFSGGYDAVKCSELFDYLEEHHQPTSAYNGGGRLSKLDRFANSSLGYATPLSTVQLSPRRATDEMDIKLKTDLEWELTKAGIRGDRTDIKKLRESFQRVRRQGSINMIEAARQCTEDRLPISAVLLEKILGHFTSKEFFNWKDFLDFLEPVVKKVANKSFNIANGNRVTQIQITAAPSYAIHSTQTNAGPDPVKVQIRKKTLYVYPSDEYANADIRNDEPDEKLILEWVYGYRGKDCRDNLSVLKSGELIYFIAAVAVIYNPTTRKQRHYTQHTDDIKCLAVHHDGVTVATGQTAGHEKVQGEPHFRVWDSNTLETKVVIGLGTFERAVVAIGFSSVDDGGKHIVTVDDDNNHTISVWDWARDKRIAKQRGHMDDVLVGTFNRFKIDDEKLSLVSCGRQHITFWTLEDKNLSSNRGRFGHDNPQPLYIVCVAFTQQGNVLTGDTNGNIYVWQEGDNVIASSVRNAHEGPVFALLALPNGKVLSGGGRDGHIRAWTWKTKLELMQTGAAELNMRSLGVTGIRTLAAHGDTLYIGTTNNCIWTTRMSNDDRSPLLEAGRADRLEEIIAGHSNELWGLVAHPSLSQFVTAGSDKTIRLWDTADHKSLWIAPHPKSSQQVGRYKDRIPVPHAVDFHPSADTIAVGHTDGSFALYDGSNGDLLYYKKCANEKISELKYSPDGACLAVASHDNSIYVYKLLNGGKAVDYSGKCEGHTSYVTHIDWSADSDKLQSTSGDYELLFWDAKKCEQITSSEDMRNTVWASHNCILGYPVAGIWPDGADGTDINTTDRSHSRRLVATGDDFGDVNLFRCPCVERKSKAQIAKGHSAHVTCVRFLADDSRLISVGGRDAGIMQWRIA